MHHEIMRKCRKTSHLYICRRNKFWDVHQTSGMVEYFSSYFLKFSILCFSYLLCFYNSCKFAGVLLNNLANEISTLFLKDLTHAGVDWRCSVLALFFYFVLELYIISSPWLSTSCITTLLMYNHDGVLFVSSLQSAYI